MSLSPQFLLFKLQRHINHPNQIKQIFALLITNGHLLFNPKNRLPHSSNLKWMNTLLYNTLIRSHLNFGETHNTIILFTHMLANQAPPNNHTFPSLIKASVSSILLASNIGRTLHSQVIRRGVSVDPFILNSLITLYAKLGNLVYARNVFDEITKPCLVSYNAMLDAYGKNEDMGSAVLLFGRMWERDVVSWTSIINGFGTNGCFQEAIGFFEKMMVHEDVKCGLVKPNEATFVTLLSACAGCEGGKGLDYGKQIHGYIVKNEEKLTIYVGTALISMYGKMGCLSSAIKVFDSVAVKGVCTWNAMISSLASNGREKEAFELFEEMMVEKMQPNEITFVTVLSACARAKLVDLGLELFESMLDKFSVVPRMEHYGCVVDLLGRAGFLKEATEFICKMPFEPDATVLGALLGACKLHDSTDLANDVGKRVLELQPWHCGRYVVLSNIFAAAEKWGLAANLRSAMVDAGIIKIPAYSSVGPI